MRGVLILLPPSESKVTPTTGDPADARAWSFPELGPARERVASALVEVSARADALEVLGVGPSLREDVAANLDLDDAPAAPAESIFDGVLFDALDLASMPPAALARARACILIFSGLHGVLRPTDRIAPFRLSMGVDLPGIGKLATFWRGHLQDRLDALASGEVVVDARSAAYGAAWRPSGQAAQHWVQIRVPGASHNAKHTRGLVAGRLCRSRAHPRDPRALAALLANDFAVTLTPPGREGQPWILDVPPPG